MFCYFISYNWTNKNGLLGSGCRIIERKEKITSKTDITELGDELTKMSTDIDDIVILNFILLDE